MRRIGLVVVCLLVAGAVGAGGAITAASAHPPTKRHQHATNHKECRKNQERYKRYKGDNRCQRRRHSVGLASAVPRTSGDPQPSGDRSTGSPTLEELIAPESACPGQSDGSFSVDSQEATMGCMINFARGRAGTGGLAGFAPLNESSDDKASDIIQCSEFSHTACGRAFTYWFQQDGYVQPGGCWGAAENLAWGTGELGTVGAIFTAWVHSPDHLENILSDSFDEFGVGLEVGAVNGYPDAHVWVTHFGKRC